MVTYASHIVALRRAVKALGGTVKWLPENVLRVQVKPGTTPFILSTDDAVMALLDKLGKG